MSHPYYSSDKSYEKQGALDCYNYLSKSYYYVMDIVVVVVVAVDDIASAAENVVAVGSFVATDGAAAE